MDLFGIGAAIRGAAAIYFRAARSTGRTTSLVNSVKNGDRVVFIDATHAREFQRLCRDRGGQVDCIVVPASQPKEVFRNGPARERLILDHCWIEAFYMQAIEQAMHEVDAIEREGSGNGEAARKSEQLSREFAKWGGL